MPRKISDGGGEVVGAAELEEVDAEIAECGEIVAGVAAFFAASIFAESHIADPVQAFDTPMSAVERQKFCGVSLRAGQTGDGVSHLDSFLALFACHAFDAADLPQARPIEMPG